MTNRIQRKKADFENTNAMNVKRSVSDSQKSHLFLQLCLPLSISDNMWPIVKFGEIYLSHWSTAAKKEWEKVGVYFQETFQENCMILSILSDRHILTMLGLVCTLTRKEDFSEVRAFSPNHLTSELGQIWAWNMFLQWDKPKDQRQLIQQLWEWSRLFPLSGCWCVIMRIWFQKSISTTNASNLIKMQTFKESLCLQICNPTPVWSKSRFWSLDVITDRFRLLGLVRFMLTNVD